MSGGAAGFTAGGSVQPHLQHHQMATKKKKSVAKGGKKGVKGAAGSIGAVKTNNFMGVDM